MTPKWRSRGTAVLGVVLIAAAAYTSGATYVQGEDSQTRGECQARVNSEVVRALQVRDDANRQISQAQRDLVSARLGNAGFTPREADQRYLDAIDRLQKVRTENPIFQEHSC